MEGLRSGDPRRIGAYRLEGRLGAGGMGEVYLGTSPGGRKVAVKVIRPELAETPHFRTRFAREVEAARKVGGFHTAQVVDADPEAPEPWLVTAYVPGPTLRDAVVEKGPLPPAEVARLGAGLAEGLAAIHACGLVHRDLKPGNVILADDGPRIIDFGIARAVDASSLTAGGSVLGTYAYMSPEQVRADRAGPGSDVFALGAVLAFAATGSGPFDAPTIPGIVDRILTRPPELGDLADPLRALLATCLAKDPADRPPVPALAPAFLGLPATPAPLGRVTPSAVPPGAPTLAPPAGEPRPAPPPGAVPPGVPMLAPPGGGPRPGTLPPAGPAPLPYAGQARPFPPYGEAGTAPGGGGLSRRAVIGIAAGATGVVAAGGIPLALLLGRGHGRPASAPTVRRTAAASTGTVLPGLMDVWTLAFDRTGSTLLATGGEGMILRWDLATRKAAVTRIGAPKYMQQAVFSADRTLLVRAEQNQVILWDVASGRTVRTFTGITRYQLQDGYVGGVALSPDGSILAAATAKGLYVWNARTGAVRAILKDVPMASDLAYSADGKLLAVGSAPARILSMPSGRLLATVDTGQADALALSPDSQLLAIANGETIQVWNTASKSAVTTLKGHTNRILTTAFSPDGRTLASGADDDTARLWNTTTGAPVTSFKATESIAAVAFSPDGHTLATGLSTLATNTTVTLWPC